MTGRISVGVGDEGVETEVAAGTGEVDAEVSGDTAGEVVSGEGTCVGRAGKGC